MSTHLPGNPYWDELMTEIGLSDDQQQISATLATAYEQRTANLIAYSVHIDDTDRAVIDQIIDRLGLNGDTND